MKLEFEGIPNVCMACPDSVMKWCRNHYRTAAFSLLVCLLFFHMSSSTGVSLAMLCGMDNCTTARGSNETNRSSHGNNTVQKVPETTSQSTTRLGSTTTSYCFSHHTKAALLGAYFYGHLAQFPFITLAHRTSHTAVARVVVLISGVLQLVFPLSMEISPYLNVGLQGFRGAIVGVILPYIMDFARVWGVSDSETKSYISVIGATIILGASFGPAIAGVLGSRLGWEFYFYVSGCSYLFLLVLMLIFIPSSPSDAFLMSEEEKTALQTGDKNNSYYGRASSAKSEDVSDDKVMRLMSNDDHKLEDGSPGPIHRNEISSAIEEDEDNISALCSADTNFETGGYNQPGKEINGDAIVDETFGARTGEIKKVRFWKIFLRTYPYAFCVYAFCSSFTYYTSIITAPFYLREVLGVSIDIISLWSTVMGVTGAVGTLVFSLIFQKLDKRLPWLQCRMVFCLIPPLIITGGNAIVPLFNKMGVALTVLLLDSLARSTAFSGSIYTINYELDPVNAPLVLGLFNTFGQLSGFINPLIMTELTGSLDKDGTNYTELFKAKWDIFFFINAGLEFVAIVAILTSVCLRRKEWKKSEK